MMTCGECGKPVPEDEEVILGEVAFHRRCSDAWCEKWAEEIAGKQGPLDDDFGEGDFE
jgi:hypothetical protein